MLVQPYLFFDGRCEEALEFYKKTLGAEVVDFMRHKENPDGPAGRAHLPPGSENKVMHASFKVGETTLMASDGMCAGAPNFAGISLTITVPNAAEADRVFAALGDGGQIQMPIGPTFFSPRFGMVADRFGVSWMIIAAA